MPSSLDSPAMMLCAPIGVRNAKTFSIAWPVIGVGAFGAVAIRYFPVLRPIGALAFPLTLILRETLSNPGLALHGGRFTQFCGCPACASVQKGTLNRKTRKSSAPRTV